MERVAEDHLPQEDGENDDDYESRLSDLTAVMLPAVAMLDTDGGDPFVHGTIRDRRHRWGGGVAE